MVLYPLVMKEPVDIPEHFHFSSSLRPKTFHRSIRYVYYFSLLTLLWDTVNEPVCYCTAALCSYGNIVPQKYRAHLHYALHI